MTEWISVKDELPNPCYNILFTDGQRIYSGWLEIYEDSEDPVFYNQANYLDEDSWPEGITHWMPFPKLPTLEECPVVSC